MGRVQNFAILTAFVNKRKNAGQVRSSSSQAQQLSLFRERAYPPAADDVHNRRVSDSRQSV